MAFVSGWTTQTVTRRGCSSCCFASEEVRAVSRRQFVLLSLPVFTLFWNAQQASARGKPKLSLELALVPIIRVQESCEDLLEGIEAGTYEGSYEEIKTIIETIRKGNDLKESVKQASLYVDPKVAVEVNEHGKTAIEYLASVTSYFDPQELKNRPTRIFTEYLTKSLTLVKKELASILNVMPAEAVLTATEALHGDI